MIIIDIFLIIKNIYDEYTFGYIIMLMFSL